MRSSLRRSPRLVSAWLLAIAIACGGGGGGGTEPPVRPPAALLSIATQPGGAVAGTPFATQPIITLRTAAGDVAVNSTATVTVTLSSGTGTLSGTTSVAAVEGVARFDNLALSAAGTCALTFTSPGLTAATSSPFGVAPLLGPPASLTFEPELTILQVGQSLGVRAMVRDAAGNVLTTPALAFEARDPAIATVDDRGVITTLARGQAVVVARTVAAPILSDSLVVVVAPPTGSVLLSGLSAFTVRRDTTLTISLYMDMRSTAKRLASGLVDVTFNPAQLTYQSFAPATFAPSVGTADAASGKLHVSFADAAGAGGTVEIVKLTFKAASTPGISGRFTLTSSEASASDFTDLLPNMVQVSQPVVLR